QTFPTPPEFGPVFSRNCNLSIGATYKTQSAPANQRYCPIVPRNRANIETNISATDQISVPPTTSRASPYNVSPPRPPKSFFKILCPTPTTSPDPEPPRTPSPFSSPQLERRQKSTESKTSTPTTTYNDNLSSP